MIGGVMIFCIARKRSQSDQTAYLSRSDDQPNITENSATDLENTNMPTDNPVMNTSLVINQYESTST